MILATSTITIFLLINQYRVQHKLPELHFDKNLYVTAIYKAKLIDKDKKYFTHFAPADFKHLMDLNSKRYKYLIAGEILGYGGFYDKELLDLWIKSPTHKVIIEDPQFKDGACFRTKISSVCHFGAK